MPTYIIVRPDGATDLAAATIHAEGTPPQNIVLAAGSWQVGRVEFAPFAQPVAGTSSYLTTESGDVMTDESGNPITVE